jgi:hypothetical protein
MRVIFPLTLILFIDVVSLLSAIYSYSLLYRDREFRLVPVFSLYRKFRIPKILVGSVAFIVLLMFGIDPARLSGFGNPEKILVVSITAYLAFCLHESIRAVKKYVSSAEFLSDS